MLPLVVVGLGNPGIRYAKTRHNLGYLAVGRLAVELGWTFKRDERFWGQVAKGLVKDERGDERTVHLLLPETYMNESGKAVLALAQYYKVLAPQVLVVLDDTAIPFGELRIRLKGSSGGHNGLKNIESRLGTPNTPRLKMGIGPLGQEGSQAQMTLADYVLAPFTEKEGESLPKFIESAVAVLKQLLTRDIHKVMTVVNVKKGTLDNEAKIKPV